MALLGTGGFDRRQERAARDTLPICADCPKGVLRVALQAARESGNPIEGDAGRVAEQLLRLTGCDSPETTPDPATTDEFAVPGSQEKVCGNPHAETAQTVITHTQLALEGQK